MRMLLSMCVAATALCLAVQPCEARYKMKTRTVEVYSSAPQVQMQPQMQVQAVDPAPLASVAQPVNPVQPIQYRESRDAGGNTIYEPDRAVNQLPQQETSQTYSTPVVTIPPRVYAKYAKRQQRSAMKASMRGGCGDPNCPYCYGGAGVSSSGYSAGTGGQVIYSRTTVRSSG